MMGASLIERHSTLPCVARIDESTLNYWSVEPTGDWSVDVERGKVILSEVVDFMRSNEEPMVLQKIVLAIKPDPVKGIDGVQAGFLQKIGTVLISA